MTDRDPQDLPPYDLVQFEQERQERAKSFAKIVQQLARFDMRDKTIDGKGFVLRGAKYDLSDGREIAVMRQRFARKPEDSTSAVRASGAWVERLGIDGKLRRARVFRHIELNVRPRVESSEVENCDVEDVATIDAVETWAKKAIEQRNFDKSFDPDYRPDELIAAWSGSIVEVKLQRGPNWRTEHEATITDKDAKLSHLAVKRHAGVGVEEQPYTIEQHQDLMFVLQALYVSRAKAIRLDDELI